MNSQDANISNAHAKWHVFAKIHIPVPPLYLLRLQRSGGMEWDGIVGFYGDELEKSGIEVLPLLPPFYPGGISFAVDWNDTKELVSKTKCKFYTVIHVFNRVSSS